MNEEKLAVETSPERVSYDTLKQLGSVATMAMSMEMEEPPKEETVEGLENESTDQKAKTAETFLKRHGRLFSLFAKDSTLHFSPAEDAETFSFSPETFTVNVPLDWFANEKYNENELQFANYHELAHFIDMRKNPKAFLGNFERMEKKAGELAKEYLSKHPDAGAFESVKGFYYNELHTLYNCLDDIYVNNLVSQRNHYFDYGDGQGSIETLYEKIGFKEPDFTSQPFHRQLVFSLLRDEMVGKTFGESKVSDEVEEMLAKKILGKSIREVVDVDLKPKQGVLIDSAERYKVIQAGIEPKYLELLEIALEQKEQEKQEQEKEQEGGDSDQQTQEGEQQEQEDEQKSSDSNQQTQEGEQQEQEDGSQQSGEQQDDSPEQTGEQQEGNSEQKSQNEGESGQKNSQSDFNPFGDSQQSPEFLDNGKNEDKVVKEILESFKEEDKKEAMSPEERAKYESKKRQEKFDEENGISKSEREEAENTKFEIKKARKEMREFWKRLIGKSVEYRTVKIKDQRRGRLNVNSYIHKYPEVIESERNSKLRELEVYDRNGVERIIVDQPEVIDISLLVDCSGSMSDGSKIQVAKRTAALLMYSIRDFNEELDMTRHQTHSKLHANTEVITFGSNYETVKPFERNIKPGSRTAQHKSNDVNIIKSISEIDSGRGGTDDAAPLGDILAGLLDDEKARIKNKKLKKIVFEITDGVPNNPTETAACIKQLSDEGVLVVGFQIGDVNNSERETFEKIWNENGLKNGGRGIYIGENIDSLPKSLMSALSDALRDIII